MRARPTTARVGGASEVPCDPCRRAAKRGFARRPGDPLAEKARHRAEDGDTIDLVMVGRGRRAGTCREGEHVVAASARR